MPDVVCILDKEGNILNVNEAGKALYEYSREDLIGMNIGDISSYSLIYYKCE